MVSIKLNKDFQRTYKKGLYKAGRFLVVYARPNNLEFNRIGIATGKRFGNSVQRNRVKRLIRESYRLTEERYKKGYDIVFMMRASVRTAPTQNRKLKAVYVPTFDEIDSEIKRLSGGLKLLK